MLGVSLSGTLTVEFNNTDELIEEVFFVGGAAVELTLDAGNYLRVTGTDIQLEVAGQTLSGNFIFEQSTLDPDGTPDTGDESGIVSITFTEVEFGLGDGTTDFVQVTDASGQFVMFSDGLYGQLSGTVGISVPDVSFSSEFIVLINATDQSRNFEVPSSLGGTETVILDPDGLIIRTVNISLNIAGQQLRTCK